MDPNYKAQVSEDKKQVVKELQSLMKDYPLVGVVNIEGLPAQQEQAIRAKLRDKVVIQMTKKRLMKIAFKTSGVNGLDKLEEYFRGMPALLFTKDNPFALFSTLKKNKSKAPAKAGQIAPNDIKVTAGPTPFAPGPVIGELGALGIKTKVDGGKITILQDTVVCKEGDEISPELAAMLTRLSIMPMEVGLDLVAIFENGEILTKSVLDIDEEQFARDITTAAAWAFNLSVEAGIITDTNRELLIQKAFRNAKAVALEGGILADGIVDALIGKAESQASAVKAEAKL